MRTSRRGTRSWRRWVASRAVDVTGAGCGCGTTAGGTTCVTATGVPGTGVGDRSDRGDVPGWVLVTLMTAGLVSALWLVAGSALVNLFQTAISHVAP